MDTSEVKVNIDPRWVSVRVRGKLSQMRLTEEVIISDSSVERSQITGMLTVKMKKVTSQPFVKSRDSLRKEEEERRKKEKEMKQQKEET